MPAVLPDIPQTEALVLSLTNKVREREKLATVKTDKALAAAAKAFAAYLAKTDTFSHTADGRQPAERAEASGYALCQIAENLALSESTQGFAASVLANETLDGWLNSPGHRANLLAPNVTDIGIAVARVGGKSGKDAPIAKYVVVQLFGRPKSLSTEFQVSNATKETVAYKLSGAAHTVAPGMGVRHTVCEPKTIEFKSVGKAGLSGRYTAESGKVYAVTNKAGKIAIEVKTKDAIR